MDVLSFFSKLLVATPCIYPLQANPTKQASEKQKQTTKMQRIDMKRASLIMYAFVASKSCFVFVEKFTIHFVLAVVLLVDSSNRDKRQRQSKNTSETFRGCPSRLKLRRIWDTEYLFFSMTLETIEQ